MKSGSRASVVVVLVCAKLGRKHCRVGARDFVSSYLISLGDSIQLIHPMTIPRQVGPLLTGFVANVNSRYEFYENDEALTLSIFDRGANPDVVSVNLEPRKVCSRRISIS